MAMRIEGVIVVIGEIPAVKIVHESVSVVVHPVVRDFPGVGPEIERQIRMAHIQAAVDDGHDDVPAPGF